MRANFAAALIVGALASAASAQTTPTIDPQIVRLVGDVSVERLTKTLQRLEAFETRHLFSSTTTPGRGIGAAREWIRDEMRSYSERLQVSFDSYDIPKQGDRVVRDVTLVNVMAILPGRSARRLYVSGHYDTVARRPGSATFDWADADGKAPGVNDDGSGTALTMELARVFAQSGIAFDATLVFIAFAGEEEGLVGAKLHAQKARKDGLVIDAVLNNDIVGNPSGGNGIVDAETVRVFSEGPEDSPSRQIARFVKRQAGAYVPSHRVELVARHDRFGRGGDHTAFNQNGFPGVRFCESNENYSRQHTVDDTLEGVSPEYLARNARVNAAALAGLALGPSAPAVVDDKGSPLLDRGESGYDARLRWKPSAGATAYRVFRRAAWTPDWQVETTVGGATALVLKDVSIDDFIFGVAAVDEAGHESLVSAYVNPSRPDTDIKTKP